MEIIEGNLIDVENREFYPCAIFMIFPSDIDIAQG